MRGIHAQISTAAKRGGDVYFCSPVYLFFGAVRFELVSAFCIDHERGERSDEWSQETSGCCRWRLQGRDGPATNIGFAYARGLDLC